MKRSNLGLVYLAIVILVAVLASCTGSRGMTNCDAAKFKMSGYR